MEKQENKRNYFAEVKIALQNYMEVLGSYLRLLVTEKSAWAAKMVLFVLALLFCGLFAFFYLNIMLAYVFANLVNSVGGGFAILTGIYLLMFLIIWFMRHKLMNKMTDAMIKMFLKK